MGVSPSSDRMTLITSIFDKYDPNGQGCVSAADLKGHYYCLAHPKVISGDLTEDEVFLDFLSHFSDPNNDGSISRCEWIDYYAVVSSCIENDEHFCTLMKKAWRHY